MHSLGHEFENVIDLFFEASGKHFISCRGREKEFVRHEEKGRKRERKTRGAREKECVSEEEEGGKKERVRKRGREKKIG